MAILTRSAALALLSGSLALAGCGKSKDTPLTPLGLLTRHNWRLTYDVVTASGAVNYADDLYAKRDACSLDDFYSFHADMTYTREEGATKCHPTDPQSYGNTWSFSDNETVLILNLLAGSYERLQIRQLDATSLELISSVTSANATFVRHYIYTAI